VAYCVGEKKARSITWVPKYPPDHPNMKQIPEPAPIKNGDSHMYHEKYPDVVMNNHQQYITTPHNTGYCDSGIYDLQSNSSSTDNSASGGNQMVKNNDDMMHHQQYPNHQQLDIIRNSESPMSRSEEFLAKCVAAAPPSSPYTSSNVMWPPQQTQGQHTTFSSQTLPSKASQLAKNSKRNPVTNDLIECLSMEEFPPPPQEFRI